ncbi:MAG: M20/M25/M40 family metallo-hydrolase, partial [Planctomycetes bacterium]|nr:M20/M25/M40 family metallo-hydrolase [Planctomycetota bacterium]
PSGWKIVFSSDLNDSTGREIDLYIIDLDGSDLERITYEHEFDGFVSFSPDGGKLVWAADRNQEASGETNIFAADWLDDVRQVAPEVLAYRQEPGIEAEDLFHHVRYLADDRLTGRYHGSDGIEFAAGYIADRFTEYGLQPVADDNTYFQQFEYIGNVRPGDNNVLTITTGAEESKYSPGEDYLPLAFSAVDEITADIVFAGYGISAPDANYDDYADIEVEGKILLLLRSTPPGDGPHGANPFLKHATLRHKLVIARGNNAAGVLFVTGPAHDDELEELVEFKPDFDFHDSGIVAASISKEMANQILAVSGKDIGELQKTIDEAKKASSFAIPGVRIKLKTDLENIKINARNVIGFLPGKSDRIMAIGAHYDHIGLGYPGSLDPNVGNVVHNGADDNASGVAGVLELAQYFAANAERPDHSILFMAYASEELGLIGSKYYVAHPIRPLENMTAMFNMDMIGHLRDNKLILSGVGTSSGWEEIVDKVNETYQFDLIKQKDGPGPSDQSSFYWKDIPVLMLFTGAHDYYNRSSDDYWRINYETQAGIVSFLADLVYEVDSRDEKLEFTKAESQGTGKGRSDLKVTLGVVPDFAFSGQGLRLDGVREGQPGHKAGLQAG